MPRIRTVLDIFLRISYSHCMDVSLFIDRCSQIAKDHFQIASLREEQTIVLKALYENRFVLAMLPTGAGKTLLYAIPSLLLNNMTIVISPLIALMRDQVRRMEEAGIPSCYLSSDQSDEDKRFSFQKIREKNVKLVFVSPERFALRSFSDLILSVKPSMIVVDEAHCIAQWGHSFRPEYLEIGKLLKEICPEKVLALTATAGRKVRYKITSSLFPEICLPKEIVFSPVKEKLFLEAKRVFSLNEKWAFLLFLLRKNRAQKSILYFQTRKACEQAVQKLRGEGFKAFFYHGGLEKDQRRDSEVYFRKTKEKIVICATNAFGMGVDLTSVGLVVVYGFPAGIEEFVQMIGRAGRQGEFSTGVLLWSGDDPVKRTYQFAETFPDERKVQSILNEVMLHFKGCASCFVPVLKDLEVLKLLGMVKERQATEVGFDVMLKEPLSLLLSSLPEVLTKRQQVLNGIKSYMLPSDFNKNGLKVAFSWPQNDLFTVKKVLDHYEQQGKLIYEVSNHKIILIKKEEFDDYFMTRQWLLESFHALEDLAKTTECRINIISRYFGVAGKDCEKCDNCLKKGIKKVYLDKLDEVADSP